MRAGTDLDLNKTIPEFFSGALRKPRSTCWLNVRWCINFLHVQGQTSNLNKTNTEFFSEALKKTRSTCWLSVRWCLSFQHVQGQTLNLITKVCPSFMLFFSFFASGVWEAQGFICTAHRGLNRHAKRESLAQTCIAKQGQTSSLNKTYYLSFGRSVDSAW